MKGKGFRIPKKFGGGEFRGHFKVAGNFLETLQEVEKGEPQRQMWYITAFMADKNLAKTEREFIVKITMSPELKEVLEELRKLLEDCLTLQKSLYGGIQTKERIKQHK